MINKQAFEGIYNFEWDKGNSTKNYLKHKIAQYECEEIFGNNPLVVRDETHSQKESRFLAYGETNKKLLLAVVYTIRNKNIRVISARPASRKERYIYERGT